MPPTLKSFTAETLRQCQERDKSRLELDRESRQLKEANDIVFADLKEALAAEGRKSIKRGDLVAELEEYRKQVAWKEQFLRECGDAKVAEVTAAAETGIRIKLRTV